jgi:hypothetical protein
MGNPEFQNVSDNDRNGVNTKKTYKIEEGYIKRYFEEIILDPTQEPPLKVDGDGSLYYAAHSKNHNYKLFATDIISLGSITDCDWQGVPKIYQSLVDTTYNRPPLTPQVSDTAEEDPEATSIIEVSGFDDGAADTDEANALILHVTCVGLFTYGQQCNNIKRLSEFGVGFDEDRSDDGGVGVDNKISNEDVDNPFIRGLFANVNGLNKPTVPLIYFDSGGEGNTSNFGKYNDDNYEEFRNVNKQDIYQYDNSFYFYFGLIPGASALTKLKRKYFSPCLSEDDEDFFVTLNSVTEDDGSFNGELDVQVIGGVGPYSFEWLGPTINEVLYPTSGTNGNSSGNIIISDLPSGTYSIRVVDSVGNVANATFVVPGPPSLTCSTDVTPTSIFGASDGIINLNASNGTTPYDYLVEYYDNGSNSTTGTFESGSFSSSVTVNGLPFGYYKVTVTDSDTNNQQKCEDIVFINQPEEMFVDLVVPEYAGGYEITCNGFDNGQILGAVDGGTAPFTYEWYKNGTLITDATGASLVDLGPGTYEFVVTDAEGAEISNTITIVEPPVLTISSNLVQNVSCFEDENTDGVNEIGDAEFTVTIGGGVPPYILNVGGTLTSESSSGTFTYSNQFSERGGVFIGLEVKDANDCETTNQVVIREPDSVIEPGYIEVSQTWGYQSVANEVQIGFDDPETEENEDLWECQCSGPNKVRNAKIRVRNYKGGWGHTLARPDLPWNDPANGYIGEFVLILQYKDTGSWIDATTIVVDSSELGSPTSYGPTKEFEITTFEEDRQYRVIVKGRDKGGPDSGNPDIITECEDVALGVAKNSKDPEINSNIPCGDTEGDSSISGCYSRTDYGFISI